MIVQETGAAMGWPLGLGHDTTGWPLGLRMRLMQKDLQYPREIDLTSSPSFTTDDSSSLDTMSTKSFFQDKSVTLATLIGISIPNRELQQRRQRDSNNIRAINHSTIPFERSSNRPPSRRARASRNSSSTRKQQPSLSATGASTQSYSHSASGTGWNLLSVLSCTRVPAQIAPLASDAPTIGPARAPQAAREVETVRLNERYHESAVVPRDLQLSFPGHRLHDSITFDDVQVEDSNHENITFDDVREKNTDHPGSDEDGPRSSKELNPMLTSKIIDDEEVPELQKSDSDEEPHHVQSATPRKGSAVEACSMGNAWTTGDRGSIQILKNLKALHVGNGFPRTPISLADCKTKAASIFNSRMVCCRSAPSSFRVET